MNNIHPKAIGIGLCVSPGVVMLWTGFELILRSQLIAEIDPDIQTEYIPIGPIMVDWIITSGIPYLLHFIAVLLAVRFSPNAKIINALIVILLSYVISFSLYFGAFGTMDGLVGNPGMAIFFFLAFNLAAIATAIFLDAQIKRRTIKTI